MRNKKYLLSLLAATVLMVISFGTAHALPYAPGETLDPTCHPGDSNCNVIIPSFTPGGDLSGTSTSQTVIGLQGNPISTTTPTSNQILQWNGSAWAPATSTSSQWTTSGNDISYNLGNVNVCNTISSTPGYLWSNANQCVEGTVDNGITRVFKTRPAAESKRIVIIGSSTAAGTGASDYAHSWAGLFTAAMTAKGYTVFNVSIPGDWSGQQHDRFYKDVAPLLPDFVIDAQSLLNDNFFISNASGGYDTHTAAVRAFIKMVEGIGAIPVVIGQYPNNNFTAEHVSYIKSLYQEWEKLGVQTWDFWGNTADANGHYINGLTVDGAHPTNAGHQAMFDAIPLTYFDAAYTKHSSETPLGAGVWVVNGSALRPIEVDLPSPASSWSYAYWARNTLGGTNLAWSGITQNLVRVKNSGTSPNNYWALSDNVGDAVLSTVNGADNTWHHIAVTYKAPTNTLTFYVDGVSIGTTTRDTLSNQSRFAFGGRDDTALNANGGQLAHIAVYRSCLEPDDIVSLASGNIVRKSLEAYLPLSTAPAPAAYVLNMADTTTRAKVNGSVTSVIVKAGSTILAP